MSGESPATPAGQGVFDAVIVGGGPRAVATVLRVAARTSADEADTKRTEPPRIALVDAVTVGPGATWMLEQPAQYLNNTQARATTIHPDDSTPMSGPAAPGPDLVDWARAVAARGSHPVGEWVVREARAVQPESFTSRRLQGVYFRDQLDEVIRTGAVDLTEVTGLVIDLETSGAQRMVVLEDGRRLRARTVVLAQGMVQAQRTPEVQGLIDAAAAHGLRYVEPGMPAERDFTALPARETVLVRGLGANFFDVIGQLVDEWGGALEEVPGDMQGRLRYIPNGTEPHLVALSGRGVPYRSKPDAHRPTRRFHAAWATKDWFTALARRGGVDLAVDVWPVIAREFARVYLEALMEHDPGALDPHTDWRQHLEQAATAAEADDILRAAIPDERWAWQVAQLRRPTLGEPVTPTQWQQHVQRLIDDELGSMSTPATHPRAAVNGAMGALRARVALLTRAGAFTGESFARDVLGWFDADGLALASGPPAHRTRIVLALLEAGILELLGPESAVTVDGETGEFVATSAITGTSARARTLVEMRMSKGKVPRTSDPLLRALLDTGRARVHAIDGVETDSMEATSAEIDEAAISGHNLVMADGTIDEAVVVLGIPAQSTQPGSAIGAAPGVPSPLLAGADVAAKQILRRAARRTDA